MAPVLNEGNSSSKANLINEMSDDTITDYTQVAQPAFQKTAEEMTRQEIRRALLKDYIQNREHHPLPIRRVLRDLFEDW